MNRPHQLDLFGATAADSPADTGGAPLKPASPLASSKAPPANPPAFPGHPQVAPPSPDDTTAPAPPANMPSSARWRVVQAGKHTIGFVLRRSRRRTVGLAVNEDGLTVTAPAWVTLSQIDDAVRDKASWVLSKLSLHRERSQRLATAETQWQAGGRIPYLGVKLVLAPDARHRETWLEGRDDAPQDGNLLHLALPADADRERLRDAAHGWLQQRAVRWLDARLMHYVALQGSVLRNWRLSAASTRWGSCSSDGRIMLNWRLIHFHPDIIDYVVAHEVAHLKHMNHSPDFWRQVEWLCPDFSARRDALRAHRPGSLPLL